MFCVADLKRAAFIVIVYTGETAQFVIYKRVAIVVVILLLSSIVLSFLRAADLLFLQYRLIKNHKIMSIILHY